MAILVFKRLDMITAVNAMKKAEKFFRDNPKRRVCKTDLFDIRRGFVVEDILEHTNTRKEQ